LPPTPKRAQGGTLTVESDFAGAMLNIISAAGFSPRRCYRSEHPLRFSARKPQAVTVVVQRAAFALGA